MFKRQFFIFGASGAYGVGGMNGGWAGLLKQYIHSALYGEQGLGEAEEVYNFAKPGAEISFVLDTFENQLSNYGRECPLSAFLSVGLNDTKAVGNPDTYLSDETKFEKDYDRLLREMSKNFDSINVLGFYDVDERKVSPKINSFDGSKSYFKNDRIHAFNKILEKVCANYKKVNFIDLSHLSDTWLRDCLFKDGLHPNDKGHGLIFEKLKSYLR